MDGMSVLWLITAVLVCASWIIDRQRTKCAFRMAGKRILRVGPAFLTMLVLFAVCMALLPPRAVHEVFGPESGVRGVVLAAAAGSVALIPGFIAFPLAAALRDQGVSYAVLAAFTTTLMMVGVATYPLEKRFFGPVMPIVRNAIALFICLLIAAVMGLVFGEISL